MKEGGALTPAWDSITDRRPALGLHCIPISSGRGESPCARLACLRRGWLRSLDGVSGDRGWLKTSKSSLESSESETSMTPSSPLVEGWDEVASSSTTRWKGSATFGMPSGIGSVVSVPSGIRPVVRKPRAATLIWYRQGSLALITHLGAWKLLEMEM